MIPLILTAELEEEFNRDWQEMRQYVVLKLADMVIARFQASTPIDAGNPRPGIEFNVAVWLKRKLI